MLTPRYNEITNLLDEMVNSNKISSSTNVADWKLLFDSFEGNEEDKTIFYYQVALKFPDSLISILAGYHGRTDQQLTELEVKKIVKATSNSKPKAKASGQTRGKTYVLINVETGEELEVTGVQLTKEDSPIGQLSKGQKDAVIYMGRTINGYKNKAGKLL
jgi:hypothetical protein